MAGLFVVGCGEPQPGDSDATTAAASSSSSGGVSMSETGDVTPTTGEDASTTGGSDSASATGTSSTSSTDGSSSGESSGTTGELVCTLAEQACAAAGQLGSFIDCGVVTPDDAVEAWQAAHDCALAAAGGQMAFKLIVGLQGIDSDVGEAYVGVTARSYALSKFFFDSDPCGGGGCGPVVSVANCTGLTATMECTVEVGNVCLSCDGAGEATQVCGPE